VGDATSDHRAHIALANASCGFRWDELIASVAANDRNLATTEPLTHRAIGGDATYVIAIDKIVSFFSLNSRQAVTTRPIGSNPRDQSAANVATSVGLAPKFGCVQTACARMWSSFLLGS
jgi:hypothetical protein